MLLPIFVSLYKFISISLFTRFVISLSTYHDKNIFLQPYFFLSSLFLHLSIHNYVIYVLLQVLCDTPYLFRVPRWCTHQITLRAVWQEISFLVFFLRSLAPLMASLLMPTRKACGRYVCHDVCLSAPTVRTLNSTIGSDLTVSYLKRHSCSARYDSQFSGDIINRTRSSSWISVPVSRQARITADDRSFRVFHVITIIVRRFTEISLVQAINLFSFNQFTRNDQHCEYH